jgi:hypothetical protein
MTLITRDTQNRKAELANTVAAIAAQVASGNVTGIIGVVFLRDGGCLEVLDMRTVPARPLVGALEVVKAKVLDSIVRSQTSPGLASVVPLKPDQGSAP